MKKYNGGEQVKPGTYLNLGSAQFVFVGEEPNLPPAKGKYVRIPTGLVLILGPLGGLAYVIFLPLAGIISLIMFTGYRLKLMFAPMVTRQAKQ